MGPEDLQKVLEGLDSGLIPDGGIGFETRDDCAVYPLENGQRLIQSVDFFTPIVDDAFSFGRIAAANSLSDIYAMGGKPLFALNIACFPIEDLPLQVLTEIMNGGQETAKRAGIPILGGHTVRDKEPKYGMVVTGVLNEKSLLRNNNAQPGDILILTKPVGTGIISTAIKQNRAPEAMIQVCIDIMAELNRSAAEAAEGLQVNACTDITGFGLLGHLFEMCQGSNVSATLEFNAVPFIKGVFELAQAGVIPGGTKKNLTFVQDHVDFADIFTDYQKWMLADAQTSGGLLFSVSKNQSAELLSRLKENKTLSYAVIGQVFNKSDKYIYIN